MNPYTQQLQSANPKSDIPRQVFLWARDTKDHAVYESLWVPALTLRRRIRGTFWTFWADRIIDLRLSICDNGNDYRTLVGEWWSYARRIDKIAPKYKVPHILTEHEILRITAETLREVVGNDVGKVWDKAMVENHPDYDKMVTVYQKKFRALQWQTFGGEPVTVEFWMCRLLEELQHSEYVKVSDWVKLANASKL